MSIRVGMHEAKTNFSKLVERARAGDEVVVERSGTPVARIVGYDERKPLGELAGAWRGRVRIAEDFDELPDEVARSLGMID